MSLVSVIVALVVVGVLLWGVGLIPMDATVRRILQVVVIVILVIWLLQVFGVLGSIGNVRIR